MGVSLSYHIGANLQVKVFKIQYMELGGHLYAGGSGSVGCCSLTIYIMVLTQSHIGILLHHTLMTSADNTLVSRMPMDTNTCSLTGMELVGLFT